ICFEEQRNNENRNPIIEIQDGEILELAVAHLNIYEVQGCVRFLFSLKPKETIFRVVQDLIKRLIDHGRLLEVYEIVNNFISEPYYLVAAISELFNVCDYPEIHEIQPCLDILCSQKNRIAKPKNIFNDRITPAIISFLEVCLYRALPNKKILQVLNYYVPIKASRMVYIGHQSSERTLYLKSLAMRAILTGELELDIEAISPQEFKNRKKNNAHNNEFREFKEVVEGLFPWYLLRIRILYDKYIKLLDDIDSINESSNLARTYRFRSDDTLPSEIAQICASIMVLYNQSAQEEIGEFYTRFLQNDKSFKIQDKLNSLRNAHRLSHLLGIRQHLENSTFEQIKTYRNDGPEEIANLYIDLARAVLTTSKNDATFYFNEAINISSKFGDEIVQRWEAVVSLAKRSCEKKIVSDELAYRFIRCAELIGENVAEKHWRRNEAMRVCTKMAPGIGISALSRWRDRDIGSLEYQSETVFNELVRTGVVSPSEGWGFIHFMPNYQRKDYLLMCLETESSNIIQETILEDAVYLFQREVTSKDFWAELKVNISKFNINNESLNYITDFYTTNKKPNKEMKNSLFGSKSHEVASGINWDEIFEGLTLSTSQDFATLITRFKYKEQEGNLNNNIRRLLREVINRLNENYFGDFIEFILQSENIDCYDILDIFSTLPQVWTNKPSFKAQWPIIVFKIGERCAQNLAGENLFNYFVDKLKLEELLTESLISGIIHGLANVEDLSDANIFFAFVRLISSSLQISEAADLLDYSLSRFELHIEDNFGDGAWNDWLKVSEDINVNVAGFLWSALGSPRSEVRWKAAHCVKTLAQFNCVVVVEALVDWLSKDTVDAFGCNKFPFYNLHARQYALMAFARISINKPDLLNKNSNLFLDYALSNAHILIQKFAAEIVLKIENKFPRTYKKASLKAIKMLGKSNLPIQEEASHYSTDSYWHNEGIIDTNISYHFAWDFDRYWYAPLGDVFRVPGKQIEELAANIIVKEWNLSNNNGYRQDPRFALWESSYRNQETWHDHSSYPRTDDLNFYLSYHAMLVLASRLMEKMPIIKSRNWHDDPWKDWISRHQLTREDGFWLVDGRNPLPLNRPLWISEDKKDTWQSDISIDDFLNCLKDKANGEMWINVKGHWHEKHNERIETYFISTALVPLKTSEAILKELSACNPYDYKLPDFEEKEIETDLGILGWISEPSFSKGLDGFDPYANGIHWPHYSVGNTIIEPLGLIIDFDSNYLQKTGSDLEKVLTCNNWSSYKASREEEPDQTGMRLKAKLSFLKHLCKTFDCSLIFDVNINREIK
ncbi:MAG TPA: hypothetical protein PLD02_09650, partial [Saprospiraceae bacterium]|nr:hypothetical protein [Saprospiraceae bacterium]